MRCHWLAALPLLLLCWGFTQEPVAIQISSRVSDGAYSLEEIVACARRNGVKIIILGERDLMKWEYGIWPLRRLVRKTVEDPSLLKYGAARYLDDIASLQEKNPDMLILPGVESAPYYYWTGSPFNGSLKINDWHRHILAFGFRTAADYERLPVTGNPRGNAEGPYGGDLGPLPYKRYVEYADARGALTFWTHPEAVSAERIGSISAETADYAGLLSRIDAYTGFFIYYEGYAKVGIPGGIWDGILMDYCAGRRKKPVWAAAGLSVDQGGLEQNMRGLRTVVLPEAFTADAVIRAMGAGRMYVTMGGKAPGFVLDEFSAGSDSGRAGMGEKAVVGKPPTVVIKGRLLHGQETSFQIKLVRNAKVIKVFEETGGEFSVTFFDEAAAGGNGYYRAEISSPAVIAVTNPVFYELRRPEEQE
jgi:hypothetical protein